VWKTGGAAYDDEVKEALGVFPEDAIVGFVYVGTHYMVPPTTIERPLAAEFLDEWTDGLGARRQASAAE
jgi:hypothetical protein